MSKLFPKDRHQKRKTEILFPHMPLFIGGANLTSLQEKSIRWAIADEVWRWKAGMVEEFRRRTHDRWNARCILVSQGGEEGDDFHDAEDLCEKREFSWECKCGAVHHWDFKHIVFDRELDANGAVKWNELAKSARLVCPECNREISDDPRNRRKLSSASRYVSISTGAPGHIAFHYDACAVWWIPWGSLAVEWVKADIDRKAGDFESRKKFEQKRKARRWVTHGNGATNAEVLACRGEYLKGTCPVEPVALTLSADVGQDTSHWTVVAWDEKGSGYVIDYGTVTSVEDLLDIASTCRFKTPEGTDATPIGGLIDSGFNTNAVYRVCHLSNGFYFPAKGSAANFGSIGESVIKEYPTMPLYTINEFASKVSLFIDRIAKRKAPFLVFPKDATEDFLNSFMGQQIITNKKGRREWRNVAGDHYADAVRLNYATMQQLRRAGAIEFQETSS